MRTFERDARSWRCNNAIFYYVELHCSFGSLDVQDCGKDKNLSPCLDEIIFALFQKLAVFDDRRSNFKLTFVESLAPFYSRLLITCILSYVVLEPVAQKCMLLHDVCETCLP
ncbi:hypothetical protein M758_1G284800 [Ceratodon purpureus]|nr:hypothetical protein M758_1G284800 [Ceratodon purpureus]